MTKFMTFNVRTDTKDDGINRFTNRTDLIEQCISEEAPSVIGFQEIVPASREFFKENLKDYVFLGCGRHCKYDGEGISIAYRRNEFELFRYETFWLSENPDKPASKFSTDQSGCPRICIASKLITREGKIINFYNTHLDHVGKLARLCGAVQIASHMADFCKKGEAVVLVGDMNALPDENTISVFENAGLVDATHDLGGTFHWFGKYLPENTEDGSDKTMKIDYIFTNVECDENSSYIVKNYEKDGRYVSDHYPVCVNLEI